MSFIRSDARQTLWRWREVLVALGVVALGMLWVFGSYGLLHLLGYAVLVLGAVMLFAGLQRVRFQGGDGGPGVVQVDEGQVAYFGPLTGGSVALGEMTALMLDPTAKPAHWVLIQPGQADLQVPLNAEGAEALFDAFATLPGIRTERMLMQMKRGADQPIVIWQKSTLRLH
jgi:hypothetical protein